MKGIATLVAITIAAILCIIGNALDVSSMSSVEQRITSLDANSAVGNLTGDDYVVYLVNAVIADFQNDINMSVNGFDK